MTWYKHSLQHKLAAMRRGRKCGGHKQTMVILKRAKAQEEGNPAVLLWFEDKTGDYIATVNTEFPGDTGRHRDTRVRINVPGVPFKEYGMVGADQNLVKKDPQKWATIITRQLGQLGVNAKAIV